MTTTAVSLRLYNTRTRRSEPFGPLRDNHVRVYVCGLTPSAEAHLGHARSFLFFDVLRRYLVHLGYRVTFVQNVTDIDDRSIARAHETGEPWDAIVAGHFASFKRSMQRLRVLEPDHEPRATAYVPQIVAMIGALIENGHAYAVGDGVYYAVASFARYGALSGRRTDELLVGARIAPGEEKRDPLDFALWKFAKAGEPSWPSPWGAGRPGWHIECSAMSHELLGEPFDIHGGGYDLVFPHHENEIAQSEPLMPAPPMVNVWMHGGLLMFDGRKMSKSLGNFEPLHELLDRHDPQAIRLLFLQTGYRKPMNFTEASIGGATTALRRLYEAYDRMRQAAATAALDPGVVAAARARFTAAMDDDVNTASAVSVLFDLARDADQLVAAGAGAPAAAFIHESMSVLGISPAERATPTAPPAASDAGWSQNGDLAGRVARLRTELADVLHLNGSDDAAVEAIVARRREAKRARDFALADRLRDALAAVGIVLTDDRDGTTQWTAR
ncbi:MAG: cysteine--tRNA ligase [Vulcanimicrobiaceae bacterium]